MLAAAATIHAHWAADVTKPKAPKRRDQIRGTIGAKLTRTGQEVGRRQTDRLEPEPRLTGIVPGSPEVDTEIKNPKGGIYETRGC